MPDPFGSGSWGRGDYSGSHTFVDLGSASMPLILTFRPAPLGVTLALTGIMPVNLAWNADFQAGAGDLGHGDMTLTLLWSEPTLDGFVSLPLWYPDPEIIEEPSGVWYPDPEIVDA